MPLKFLFVFKLIQNVSSIYIVVNNSICILFFVISIYVYLLNLDISCEVEKNLRKVKKLISNFVNSLLDCMQFVILYIFITSPLLPKD